MSAVWGREDHWLARLFGPELFRDAGQGLLLLALPQNHIKEAEEMKGSNSVDQMGKNIELYRRCTVHEGSASSQGRELTTL